MGDKPDVHLHACPSAVTLNQCVPHSLSTHLWALDEYEGDDACAGSERQKAADSEGQQLREASAINRSLSALGLVINKLVSGQTHIPYRDSKLTFLLQASLPSCKNNVLETPLSQSHLKSAPPLVAHSRSMSMEGCSPYLPFRSSC